MNVEISSWFGNASACFNSMDTFSKIVCVYFPVSLAILLVVAFVATRVSDNAENHRGACFLSAAASVVGTIGATDTRDPLVYLKVQVFIGMTAIASFIVSDPQRALKILWDNLSSLMPIPFEQTGTKK